MMHKLEKIIRKQVRRAVGLMSGTSADGIDAALVEISGAGLNIRAKLIAFENRPYPDEIRNKIFELFDPQTSSADKIGYMNFLLGELYAEAAISVIAKAGMSSGDVDVIGSHGQTIYHAPEVQNQDGYNIKYTVQIGEGAVIACRTGIPCISDFRVADMAAGGQGAPLVPYTEFLLYRSGTKNILLQNIGGIGNITVLPAGCTPGEVTAFDTGPGNMVIDGLVEILTCGKMKMDTGGKIAETGKVNEELLEILKKDPYFLQKPPKSTGREHFGSGYIKQIHNKIVSLGIPGNDAVATVTDLTAWSIEDAYRKFIYEHCTAEELILGGGGSYNPVLVDYIRQRMKAFGVKTLTQEEIGHNSDAKEAAAFAVLADRTVFSEYNNLPGVTGAKLPVVMGKISF